MTTLEIRDKFIQDFINNHFSEKKRTLYFDWLNRPDGTDPEKFAKEHKIKYETMKSTLRDIVNLRDEALNHFDIFETDSVYNLNLPIDYIRSLIHDCEFHEISLLSRYFFLNRNTKRVQASFSTPYQRNKISKALEPYYPELDSNIYKVTIQDLDDGKSLMFYSGKMDAVDMDENTAVNYGYLGEFMVETQRMTKKIPWLFDYISFFARKIFKVPGNDNIKFFNVYTDESEKYLILHCKYYLSDITICSQPVYYHISIIYDQTEKVLRFYYSLPDQLLMKHLNSFDLKLREKILPIILQLSMFLYNLYINLNKMLDGDDGYETALRSVAKYPGIPLSHPELKKKYCADFCFYDVSYLSLAVQSSVTVPILVCSLISPQQYTEKFANMFHSDEWKNHPEYRTGWELYLKADYWLEFLNIDQQLTNYNPSQRQKEYDSFCLII